MVKWCLGGKVIMAFIVTGALRGVTVDNGMTIVNNPQEACS